MKDPYSVLGAKKGDDPQELLKKYNELRNTYDAERKLSGDKGNDGKRKLHELDEAWVKITEEIGAVEPKDDEKASDSVKNALDSVEKELDNVGKQFQESDIGKGFAKFEKKLEEGINNFFGSVFGKKK